MVRKDGTAGTGQCIRNVKELRWALRGVSCGLTLIKIIACGNYVGYLRQ